MDEYDDLLRSLNDRPDVLRELRRQLFPKEVLDIPDVLSEIVSVMKDMIDVQKEQTEFIKIHTKEIIRFNDKGEKIESKVDGIDAKMVGLGAISGVTAPKIDAVHAMLESLAEYSFERRMETTLPPILSGKLGLRRARAVYRPGLSASRDSDFARAVEDAADELRITDAQEDRIKATDLVIQAQRKADRSGVWIAVEASIVISEDDIDKAAQSADALRTVFGDAAAVAFGARIDDDLRARAAVAGVAVVVVGAPTG